VLGDPCAYLNDAGTAVEKGGWDYHSNQGDCQASGGVWVPPGDTIKFTAGGDYYFTQSVWQSLHDPSLNGGFCQGLKYYTWGTRSGAIVLSMAAPFTATVSAWPAGALGLASLGGDMARSGFNCQ
jgi:hypothetical protein